MTTTQETPRTVSAVDIAAGDINVRTARQLARERSAARTANRKRERELATSRGWLLLTADNVRDMLTAGESIGREYLGSDAAEIATAGLDRVARWLGGLDPITRDTGDILARLGTSRGASGYAARLARLAARQYAARHGTGRGSMPRLSLSDDELDDRLTAVYGARSHSVATATAARVDSGETDHLELGERVASAYWHAVLAETSTTYRQISDDELGEIRRVSRFERTAAAPMFSRWLDAYGDSVPTASAGHTLAHSAPGVPERDTAPLRRGSLRERLSAVGVDPITTAAAVLAMDRVSTRRVSDDGSAVGRFPRRVYWSSIAADVGAVVVPATLARRVTAALELLADAESLGAEIFADDGAASSATRVAAIGTGRVIGRGSDDGDAVTYSTTPRANVPTLDRDVIRWSIAAGHSRTLTVARILAISTAGTVGVNHCADMSMEYDPDRHPWRESYGVIPR